MPPPTPSISISPWLISLDREQIETGALPLSDLLGESLYYPASAQDGFPVKALGNLVQSFIYVDYGHTRDAVMEQVWRKLPRTTTKPEGEGLRGYRVLGTRDVTKAELIPNGWAPPRLQTDDMRRSPRADWIKSPFAFWVVFERISGLDDYHGPVRLSLLYICGDGPATYHALYRGHEISARYIVIINPGTGFGGNWTDFRQPDKILWRMVMENPFGQPAFFVGNDWNTTLGNTASWPEFSEPVGCLCNLRQIGLWTYPSS